MATSTKTPIEIPACDSQDPQEKEDPESVLDEIDKLDLSKLPPELQSIDKEKLKQMYNNAKSISILVTGKTGNGKSTLINGILGLNIEGERRAKEGHNLELCTTTVEPFHAKKGNMVATVWDSPGLQDGTDNQEEYLKQMKEKCSNRDLTMYCIKISDTRLARRSDEVKAMDQLTKTFGAKFWKTTIIVLTFANATDMIDENWDFLPEKDRPLVFERKIEQWRQKIREILTNEIKIPTEIVEAIRIVPAGSYRKPHLPGYRFWLSHLWFHCLHTISTPEVQATLVKMNAGRFRRESEVRSEDFYKPPERQPIVADSGDGGSAIPAVCALIGAGVGTGVGAVGVLAGPFAGLTIPAGAVVGGLVGAGTAKLLITIILKVRKKYASTH